MDNKKKASKFGFGLLLGAIGGALAGLFLSPNTGKQNRKIAAKKFDELKKFLEEHEVDEKVKEAFGVVSEEAKALYLRARVVLLEKLTELKKTVDDIDTTQYQRAVEDTIKSVQKEFKKDVKQLEMLKKQLMKEWDKLNPF